MQKRDFLKQQDRPLRIGNHYYYRISENTNPKIEAFGIYGNNRLNLRLTSSQNIISKSDNKILDEIAKNYLPQLLKILESERDYSKKIYSKLGYNKEITFEEFFIWWYHFIYTQSTNEMNEKGALSIPVSGNFDYIIED